MLWLQWQFHGLDCKQDEEEASQLDVQRQQLEQLIGFLCNNNLSCFYKLGTSRDKSYVYITFLTNFEKKKIAQPQDKTNNEHIIIQWYEFLVCKKLKKEKRIFPLSYNSTQPQKKKILATLVTSRSIHAPNACTNS